MKEKIAQVMKRCYESIGTESCCSLMSMADCPCKSKMREVLKTAASGGSISASDALYILNHDLPKAAEGKTCGDSYVFGCALVNEIVTQAEGDIVEIENAEMQLVKVEVKGNLPNSCLDCRIGRNACPRRCPLNGEYQSDYGWRPDHCPLVLVK